MARVRAVPTVIQQVLDDEATQAVETLKKARAAIREWEALEIEARNTLLSKLGPADHGTVAGVPVIECKRVRTKRLNTVALREAHPEIWQAFAVESISTRLTFPGEQLPLW